MQNQLLIHVIHRVYTRSTVYTHNPLHINVLHFISTHDLLHINTQSTSYKHTIHIIYMIHIIYTIYFI